jgi:hypothetical protein
VSGLYSWLCGRPAQAQRYTASLSRTPLLVMKVTNNTIEFSERDFKEVFSLFTSATAHELNQIGDPANDHYFDRVDLTEQYELCFEKREFAIDALRAVLAFLHRHGYRLEENGNILSLDGVANLFVV